MTDEPDTELERLGTEPVDGNGTYPFAGLTRYDENVDVVTLPQGVWTDTSSMRYWAQNKSDRYHGNAAEERDVDPSVLPERGLNTLIRELPRATSAEVAVRHPRTGEEYTTLKSKAVVNPARIEQVAAGNHAEIAALWYDDVDADDMADAIQSNYASGVNDPVRSALETRLASEQADDVMAQATMDDALFNIPTSSYTIVNPSQFLPPLAERLQERGMGEQVFGEVRLDRDGGRATLDLFVDGQHVESPVFAEDREPVVVGLEVQWDFFGDWAVRASGQAIDWGCINRIHKLTDREIVKHAGDVESRQDWAAFWDSLLDRLDEKRDQLSRIIQRASEETLDFSELPDDIASEFEDQDAAPWTALYAYMGLPDYLAVEAGRELRTVAEDPYDPNWWEIHRGATFAVTHESSGDRIAGGSYDDQARVANDALFNPATMEDRIVENYEADHDPDQGTLADEAGGIADIRNAFESVRDKKEQYEQWEEDLREMGVEV